MEALAIILMLIVIIVSLIAFAIMQIQMAGIEIKDFWFVYKSKRRLR